MSDCYGESLVGSSGVNGDRFYISPDKTTMMLSDGASGSGTEGKAVMSAYCVKIISENPFAASGLSAKEYLEKIIWKINNGLIEISQRCKTYIFGTLTICVTQNNQAVVASMGDSPAYVIHKNGIKRLAKTVKTYQNLIEMGVLTEEKAEKHVHTLPEHMWSMFDSFIPMVVPVYALEEAELSNNDRIVLCSDGVSDYVEPEEIRKSLNPDFIENSVMEIINTAKERAVAARNRYDDTTMVVYCHRADKEEI